MQRAFDLHLRWQKDRLERRSAEEVLEQARCGFVVLDQQGRLAHANREADRILREQDGLVVRGGVLRALDKASDEWLRSSIQAAVATTNRVGQEPGGVVSIRRTSGLTPYAVTVAPLHREGWFGQFRRASAVVLLRDPAAAPEPDAAKLQRLFGFTPAEARVACALLSDQSREQIAGEFQVTANTIRTQVRSVYAKAGVPNRSALVRMLTHVLGACSRGSNGRG
jgi:DNA-binding CsgD family transcriptional regulator